MRRGVLRSPATWRLGLPLAALACLLLAAAAPAASARRPKAPTEGQASDRGGAAGRSPSKRSTKRSKKPSRKRSSRRSTKRPRKRHAGKARGKRKSTPRAETSAARAGHKRVGKTSLVRLKYTVKRGDTLSRVARKLHVSVDQLRWWNRWLRKGSTLRVGARVAYLVDQAELDRRDSKRHEEARAKKTPRGHRHAARVARTALVNVNLDSKGAGAKAARHDSTAASKDVRALRAARATRAELGKAPRPPAAASPEVPEAPAGDEPAARADNGHAPAGDQPGLPIRPTAPTGPTAPTAPPTPAAPPTQKAEGTPRGAVAKLAGAARGVVATVAASASEGSRSTREAPRPARDETSRKHASRQHAASKRAAGRQRTTTGDFPSYRVSARDKQAEAIGSPNHGRLRHGVEMPIRGPGFRRISTKKRFATDQTIALVRYAAARLAAQFPGTRPMLVNAMSAKGGGPVRPHHSHQNGLDVDILYFQKGNPKHPKRGNLRPDEIDYVKTWFVLETLLLTGKFNYAFTDRSFIPGLRRQARRAGWTKRALRKIFGDPSGKGRKGLIRHWSGHRGHFHVRFTCHPADKRCEHSHFY